MHKWRLLVVLLAVQLAFASWHIIGRVLVEKISPLTLVTVRVWGGAFAFACVSAFQKNLQWPREVGSQRLIRLALFGFVLNPICFTWGLTYTSAVNATVLISTAPFVAVTFAIATGREQSRTLLWVGTLLAFVGSLIVADPVDLTLGKMALVGNILIVLNRGLRSTHTHRICIWWRCLGT